MQRDKTVPKPTSLLGELSKVKPRPKKSLVEAKPVEALAEPVHEERSEVVPEVEAVPKAPRVKRSEAAPRPKKAEPKSSNPDKHPLDDLRSLFDEHRDFFTKHGVKVALSTKSGRALLPKAEAALKALYDPPSAEAERSEAPKYQYPRLGKFLPLEEMRAPVESLRRRVKLGIAVSDEDWAKARELTKAIRAKAKVEKAKSEKVDEEAKEDDFEIELTLSESEQEPPRVAVVPRAKRAPRK